MPKISFLARARRTAKGNFFSPLPYNEGPSYASTNTISGLKIDYYPGETIDRAQVATAILLSFLNKWADTGEWVGSSYEDTISRLVEDQYYRVTPTEYIPGLLLGEESPKTIVKISLRPDKGT